MSALETEPTRVAGLINAALAATIGVLTLTETVSPELGGGLTAALAAWVLVGMEFVRAKVTPTAAPKLTTAQAADTRIVD